jgi:hypothetical protein
VRKWGKGKGRLGWPWLFGILISFWALVISFVVMCVSDRWNMSWGEGSLTLKEWVLQVGDNTCSDSPLARAGFLFRFRFQVGENDPRLITGIWPQQAACVSVSQCWLSYFVMMYSNLLIMQDRHLVSKCGSIGTASYRTAWWYQISGILMRLLLYKNKIMTAVSCWNVGWLSFDISIFQVHGSYPFRCRRKLWIQ